MNDASWIVQRMCTNKKAHTKEIADRIVDEHANRKSIIYYYKCDLCGKFHMTSKTPNEVKRRIEIK